MIFISPSFHLVSHFKGIGGKYETNAHFRRTLPAKGHLISMKREGERNEALISPLTTLVSRHFMFRFTVPLVATNSRRTNSGQALFVRSLYCFGASEAARLWKRLFQRDRLLRFFNELLKARVAAQGVPPREQFEPTVAEWAWETDALVQLFEGEIFVANPGGNHCQIQ